MERPRVGDAWKGNVITRLDEWPECYDLTMVRKDDPWGREIYVRINKDETL